MIHNQYVLHLLATFKFLHTLKNEFYLNRFKAGNVKDLLCVCVHSFMCIVA